ncbi:RICIN domain-containing protein [Actinoallomurus sp. NBC_01490]|uniref:RICIN domain-containing protein n=1 Tax=Actinoallomurus sp. NBC_01490 TaxID=2903557 RepID=UPI002E302434|nr:RICIN domain-containing protein [Actinoallomurus sp. NBC_01490]
MDFANRFDFGNETAGRANRQWQVNADGTITGVQSGRCLDVTGASTADGALVELWRCNGGGNQKGP